MPFFPVSLLLALIFFLALFIGSGATPNDDPPHYVREQNDPQNPAVLENPAEVSQNPEIPVNPQNPERLEKPKVEVEFVEGTMDWLIVGNYYSSKTNLILAKKIAQGYEIAGLTKSGKTTKSGVPKFMWTLVRKNDAENNGIGTIVPIIAEQQKSVNTLVEQTKNSQWQIGHSRQGNWHSCKTIGKEGWQMNTLLRIDHLISDHY
ncbi:hypothetical protein niasHS_006101 [Heterodera schachtii]|uniref:Uncharacterized protein n=1 Tax=Heterodera schachtii TaxID=97005 RepID=A0ABD2JVY9_HETSC